MINLDLYPSVKHLHAAAKKKLPKFSFDYVEGGTGLEAGLKRNRDALDSTTMNPKYISCVPRIIIIIWAGHYIFKNCVAVFGERVDDFPKSRLCSCGT